MPFGKLCAAVGLCLIVYIPFLSVPMLGDDYVQIQLGRQYGPLAAWPDLAQDVLYRCRATSVLWTYFFDALFGADAAIHRLSSLLLHFANIALILLLGVWPRIGWAVSVPAAVFFGIHEGHQEAVVWTAANHEPLVFLFGLGCVHLWLQERRAWAFLAFVLALLSKESGVVLVPAVAWLWWREQKADRAGGFWVAAMGALALAYAGLIFAAKDTHLHLNDAGTFSWRAPFAWTLARSAARVLWFWGVLAACLLLWWRARRDLLWMSLGWIVIALAPYSFLTYMDRVPSRHTYLAAAGLALLVGGAFAAARERLPLSRQWAVGAMAALVMTHNAGYLWVKKLGQYYDRAEPTERFLEEVRRHDGEIVVTCGAYPIDVYRAAAMVRLGADSERVQRQATNENHVVYCDPLQP